MGFVARLTGVHRMTWPWVSRAAYERACQARDDAQRLLVSQHRFDALLDRYHALKLAGGVPEPAPPRVAVKPPDVVTQAMIARAKGSRVLLKQFGEFVTEQRTIGTPDDEIAQAILAGIPDDEGVPG